MLPVLARSCNFLVMSCPEYIVVSAQHISENLAS